MADEHTGWTLVEQVKAGDDRAFDALMARYKRPVLNFVYRMIGDAAEAEDVAQDVFVRAYQTIRKPGFHQTTGAFSTWLFQVARNAAIDCLRRRRRNPVQSAAVDASLLLEAIPASGSVSQEVAAREIGALVAAAIAKLPEDQRTAVALAEYEGLSYKEIAAVMRCSIKSVEARLYRSKHTLRHALRGLLQ